MSMEYTIDIQLTELGFPNIFEATETPVKDAPGRELPDPAASGSPPLNPQAPIPPIPSPPTDRPVDRQLVSKEGEDRQVKETVERQGTDKAGNAGTGNCNGTGTRNGQLDEESEETDDSGVSEQEEEDEYEEEDGLDPELEAGGSGAEHRCGVCDIILPSASKLQDHMNMHTGKRPYCCAECGKRFCQRVSYQSHLRSHSRPKSLPEHSCRICLKFFQSDEYLKAHQNAAHLEQEFYECDTCKRIFTDKEKCQDHIEWHRTTMGRHVCPKCGRHFLMQRTLSRHQQRSCLTYKCSDCSLVFHSKTTLLQHSFTHLGLPPYTCIQCRTHFRLAKHYNKHTCEPDRINCVACLGVFLSQADFQKHKKETGCWGHQGSKGDEIRCMECGERFASAEELKKHAAGAHQRVLTCFECGKGFRSSLMLMSHMGGHAGQRPCLCQKCGLGFPHQQVYDGHLKNCGNIVVPTMAPKKARDPQKNVTARLVHKVTAAPLPAPKLPSKRIRQRHPPDNIPNISTNPKLAIPKYVPANYINGLTNGAGTTVSIPAGVLCQDSEGGGWKLALDKEPPPGVKLVVFVPANSPLSSSLAGLPSISATPPPPPPTSDGQATQRPELVLPPAPRPNMEPSEDGSNAAVNLSSYRPSDVPLDLVKRTVSSAGEQEPREVLPLDLSSSSTSSARPSPGPPPITTPLISSIKSEPKDPYEFSEEPLDCSAPGGGRLIKTEPQPPGPDGDETASMWASEKLLAWRLEMENDVPLKIENVKSLREEESKEVGGGEIGRGEERDRGLKKERDVDSEAVKEDRALKKEQNINGEAVESEKGGGVLKKIQGVVDSEAVEVDEALKKEKNMNVEAVESERRDGELEEESECIDSCQSQPLDLVSQPSDFVSQPLNLVSQHSLHNKRGSVSPRSGLSPDMASQSSSSPSPPPSTPPTSKRAKLA